MTVYADMHVHTNHSDGTQTIDQVMKRAADLGIHTVAVTDHDTVDTWEEVRSSAAAHGIQTVRGVEMSCYDESVHKKIHVVGLWLGEDVSAVQRLCEHTLVCRDHYHKTLVLELAKKGYPLDYDRVREIAPFGVVFKIHLFQALMERYPESMSVKRYRELFAGKTTYEVDRQMGYTPIAEGIAAIREAGGLPVIAHPCEYDNYDEIPAYVELGLQGIEVSHPSMKEEDYPRTRSLARHFNLAQSGGSDYHDPDLTPWFGRYGLTAHEFAELEARALSRI